MKKILALAAIVLLLLPGMAVAAGTCTATSTESRQSIIVVTWTCVADASDGSYPATASNVGVRGWLYAVDTIPGSTQPTDNWDATITNASGYDLLGGGLTNRDTANAERAIPTKTAWVDGPITLTITGNSVNSANIVVKAYIYKEN